VKIYKCDRCGISFAESGPLDVPHGPTADAGAVGLTNKMPLLKGARIVIAEVDMCGECVRGLCHWMMYRKDDEPRVAPRTEEKKAT
jgi:hypothetical protein